MLTLDGRPTFALRRSRWEERSMSSFDDDVIIIGSGFGGSVAVLHR